MEKRLGFYLKFAVMKWFFILFPFFSLAETTIKLSISKVKIEETAEHLLEKGALREDVEAYIQKINSLRELLLTENAPVYEIKEYNFYRLQYLIETRKGSPFYLVCEEAMETYHNCIFCNDEEEGLMKLGIKVGYHLLNPIPYALVFPHSPCYPNYL